MWVGLNTLPKVATQQNSGRAGMRTPDLSAQKPYCHSVNHYATKPKCVNISKTVQEIRPKLLLIMTSRKLHIHQDRWPWMTLNCYKFECSENFAGFQRFGRQQHLNEWNIDRTVSDTALQPTECVFQHYVPCIDLPYRVLCYRGPPSYTHCCRAPNLALSRLSSKLLKKRKNAWKCTIVRPIFKTRSQAVARIADRTAKNCRGHVT